MKKRFVIHIALALGIALGYLPLNSWLFRTEEVQAQCLRYFLSPSSGSADGAVCGAGNTRVNVVLCNPGTPPYNTGADYIALCIGP